MHKVNKLSSPHWKTSCDTQQPVTAAHSQHGCALYLYLHVWVSLVSCYSRESLWHPTWGWGPHTHTHTPHTERGNSGMKPRLSHPVLPCSSRRYLLYRAYLAGLSATVNLLSKPTITWRHARKKNTRQYYFDSSSRRFLCCFVVNLLLKRIKNIQNWVKSMNLALSVSRLQPVCHQILINLLSRLQCVHMCVFACVLTTSLTVVLELTWRVLETPWGR